MTKRWLIRISGGAAALAVSAALVLPITYSGALNWKANNIVSAGTCDCSKCRSDQVCCATANGYCGCFPAGIKC